jgi:hypothetical protein
MMQLNITTTVLGLGLAGTILMLVRRDHLHLSHGVFWIVVAVAAVVLGSVPGLIDRVASVVGVSYPPALLLLAAVLVLLVKSLLADIANTRNERRLRRLSQQLALHKKGSRNEE